MKCSNRLREVTHMAIGARVLENRAKYCPHPSFRVADNHLNAQRLRPGLHHGYILRMAIFIHERTP